MGRSVAQSSHHQFQVQPKEQIVKSGLIAPVRPALSVSQPWKGVVRRRPWSYQVTAVIPHLDTPEQLAVCVAILRAQSVPPFIVVVDTGSLPENLAELEKLRADDLEIHKIQGHSYQHSSEVIAIACQLGQDLSRTPFVFQTHADCFLVSRTLLEDWAALAAEHLVVGYRISPRDYAGWEKEFGHTALMMDVNEIRRVGVMWNLRAFAWRHRDKPDPFNLAPNCPDTESEMNARLQDAGITGLILGDEENFRRNINPHFDHPRSFCCSKLYSPEYHSRIAVEMTQAMKDATERLQQWKSIDLTNPECTT